MLRTYDDPNTCYVIGDAVARYLGTATETYQPAVGVEAQISCMVKTGTTDAIGTYDGTSQLDILEAAPVTASGVITTNYNTAFMVTNSMYIRKAGTSNRIYIGGMETNI